jgi:tRNA A-37 threonylcarbamoyl transferase component Bud32
MAVRRMLVAGRYRLHEVVGTGGMGRVWLARDEMLDRDVAVKEFVPPEWMTEAEKDRLRDRTLREARSAGRLNHPHVVRVYDVVHEDGQPWIVMEYVPSRSLHQVINEDGPYSPAAAARIGLAVLDALTAAHRAGVLHRDVKPHNVLIGSDGRVVLTDFGLATFVDDGSVTGPGLVVGSPQYVSPERARDGASTVESDLWSFGATLYAAVEGRSPYARESAMASLMSLATEPPDPPRKAGPLAPVLTGLLRHEPADRLTASDVDRRLRMIVAGTPGGVTVPAQRRGGSAVTPEAGRAAVAVRTPPAQRTSSAPISPAAPVPAPPPRVPAHHRPKLVVALLSLVAMLGVGGILLGYLVKHGDSGNRATPAVPLGLSATSSPAMVAAGFSPATCGGTAPVNAPLLPQRSAARGVNGWQLTGGWSYFTDGTGFHVPVPDGWTWQKVGAVYCFRDPSGGRVLSLDTARNPAGDPVKACTTEEARLVAAGALPGYQRISIEAKPLLEKAAEWDYRYDDPSGLPLRARTRWFAMNGKAYALSWATREIDWPADLAKLNMVMSSFYPDRSRPSHS